MRKRDKLESSNALALVAVAIAAVFVGATAASAGAEGEGSAEEMPAAAPAAAAEEAPKEGHGLRVRMLGTGAIVDGDVSQFQQRHRVPDVYSGGVDEFHYETEIAEDTELEIDGRAIFDNHDYLLSLGIENEDKGYFKAGYREFRTWYDGRGGFFNGDSLALADASFQPFDPELATDRGEAWAKGGLVLPQGFKLDLGYRYLSRDGTKSSATWGDTSALGIPPSNNRRNIVPAFWDIDEDRHLVDIDLARATEVSEIGAGLRYEHTELNNSRNVVRVPGEAAERRFTESDLSETDLWSTRVFASRRLFDDKVTVSSAYAYNDIDLSVGGSRIYGATFNASFDPMSPNRQQRDEGFFDLGGTSQMREHVANVSASIKPFEDVQVLTGFRVRSDERFAHVDFVESNVGASPTFTTVLTDLDGLSDTDETSWAEELEVRYKGIEDVVLYAGGRWEQDSREQYEVESEIEPEPLPPVVELERNSDVDRLLQNYAVGAKYYPVRWMNVSTEYAYRMSDWSYDHSLDSTSNDPANPPPGGSSDRYPAYFAGQQFATHDFNVRTSLRLPANVGLVLRYDWMQTTIDTRQDGLDKAESAQTRAHVISSTLSWNPASWIWTRGGFNYMLNETDTPADDYSTPVAAWLANFNNNYASLNLASGIAIDDRTDAEFLYTYTMADNYQDVSASSVAYGSRFGEHGVSLRAARRLSDCTKVGLGYGYYVNDEGFAGGNYDYNAHIITTSVEFTY